MLPSLPLSLSCLFLCITGSGKLKIDLLDEREYNVLSIKEIPYKSIEPCDCILYKAVKLKVNVEFNVIIQFNDI